MIEHLRKYTGLIVVLFVLVLIGFFFMDRGATQASQGSGVPYLKIAGRNYTDKEYQHLGTAAYELTQNLAQTGDFQLYTFLFTLSGDAKSPEQAQQNFFSNRILLRSAKSEFGIYPGEAEIDNFIRQLRAFASPDGAFDQARYRDFIKKGIGQLGLTEADVRELASDILTQRKLAEILGAGLTTSSEIVARKSALTDQRINADVARIDIDPIEEKIKVSEKEIKTYWETIQDAFKTPEKRKFTYLFAKPEFPIEPAEIAAPAADASKEVKAKFEKEKAARSAKIAEDRRLAQTKTNAKFDDFLLKLETDKSATFEALAKEDGWDFKATELFAVNEAPDDLKTPLASANSQGIAADELFKMIVTSDPFSKISPPLQVGESDYLIARLDGIEKSRTQTFEEARADARARLISEKATAALKKAAEDAVEKIKASLAKGKTFAEAAKAAGITNEATSVTEVTTSYQGDTTKIPSNLFEAAQYTDPSGLTEPVIETDRAFIIHVSSREVVKPEDTALAAQVKQAAESNRITAFTAWLGARAEAANIEQLNRR